MWGTVPSHDPGPATGLSEPPLIAVILTCHNRRAITVRCLKSLRAQFGAGIHFHLDLYLVDDGSSDGTTSSALAIFPNAQVIQGDGELYWAGGMALAEREAVRSRPDFLLWLNDDVELFEGALRSLLSSAFQFPRSIVVGATVDPSSGRVTYGARRRARTHPGRLTLVELRPFAQRGDSFNGNCVLVPLQIHDLVGPIDSGFSHSVADWDYGLRATALGIGIWQVPLAVGTCSDQRTVRPCKSPWQAWRTLQEPTGMPWGDQARYLHRHGPPYWPYLLIRDQLIGLIRLCRAARRMNLS